MEIMYITPPILVVHDEFFKVTIFLCHKNSDTNSGAK